jgi:hypothetical protein
MTTPVGSDPIFVEYRPRPWRRRALLTGLAVALLLVGLVYAVRGTVSSPGSAVTGYFDALADRDAAAALRLLAPEVADRVDRELVNPAVLGSDAYTPPAEVEVTDVTVDGRNATAEVAYTLGGGRHTASLRLRRDEGIVDAVVHRWRVVDGVGSLLLRDPPAEVTVNGARVPAHDAQGPRVLPALPGGYQVGVADDDPLWQARSVSAQVAPQRTTEVAVPLVPRPEVRDEVDRQVTARLDACAASTALVPPGCPFGYAVTAGAEAVEWRIVRYPNLGLTAGAELGRAVMVVHSTTDGEAMVTGRGRFGPVAATVPFPVSGVVSARGGSLVFEPGW